MKTSIPRASIPGSIWQRLRAWWSWTTENVEVKETFPDHLRTDTYHWPGPECDCLSCSCTCNQCTKEVREA